MAYQPNPNDPYRAGLTDEEIRQQARNNNQPGTTTGAATNRPATAPPASTDMNKTATPPADNAPVSKQ